MNRYQCMQECFEDPRPARVRGPFANPYKCDPAERIVSVERQIEQDGSGLIGYEVAKFEAVVVRNATNEISLVLGCGLEACDSIGILNVSETTVVLEGVAGACQLDLDVDGLTGYLPL